MQPSTSIPTVKSIVVFILWHGTRSSAAQPATALEEGWASYTQQVLGISLWAAPDVLWCGMFSPATMPPIKYGQNKIVPGWGCDWNGPDLAQFNPGFWTRPKELPFDKYWIPEQVLTYPVSVQPLDYIDCNNEMSLPQLRSKLPFTQYWYSNVAIGPYWFRWMRKRKIPRRRLWRPDLCISVWFGTHSEVTLKVTDVDSALGPTDIKVEPAIYEWYLKDWQNNKQLIWTFTKCWGNALMHPRYYVPPAVTTQMGNIANNTVQGGNVNTTTPMQFGNMSAAVDTALISSDYLPEDGNMTIPIVAAQRIGVASSRAPIPLYRNCLPWVVAVYQAQVKILRATDPWYNKAAQIPKDQWPLYPQKQKPNVLPRGEDGQFLFT